MKPWFRKTETSALPDTETKANSAQLAPLGALSSVHLGGRAQWTPRDYAALAREGYQKNAIVYRCIRLIAEASASVPICAERAGQCDPDDPAVKLLRSPHPTQTAADLFEALYGYLQVSGNAYLEASFVDDKPAALYALRPDRTRVVLGRGGWPAGYEYGTGKAARTLRRDPLTGQCPVFHMRLFHPTDDTYGFSPLESAAHAVDIHNQGGVWAKALLDNSARPSGALIYKGVSGSDRLTDEQFDRLKSELEGSHTGARRAGRPLLLEGGLDWKAMSLSPADMDFIEARREAAREIALAFGIPPMLLGIPGDNTYANYREAQSAFWRQTVLPLVTKTARAMELWLRPYFGESLDLRPDISVVPALAHDRLSLGSILKDLPFISDAEKRAILGFTAERAGDHNE